MQSPTQRRLSAVVPLEERCQPSVFHSPWPDAESLTLSFVSDGTQTPIGASSLSTDLSDLGPSAEWQREILRAFQTWAVHANINIGLRADAGQPIGTVGAVQGDDRFGDVRVASVLLGEETVAAASPFSWIGTTFSGDLVLNSGKAFSIGDHPSKFDVFSVALHEAGHALGLGHTDNPQSIMQEGYQYAQGLSAADIAELQALYGPRVADPNDIGWQGNDSRWTATPMERYGLLETRFRSGGDLTTTGDVDWYSFTTLPTLSLTDVAVQLRAAGQSLLTAKVTVYTSSGRVVASMHTTDPLDNDLTVRFRNGWLGGTYYIKVESARTDVFRIGGYQLFADTLKVTDAIPVVSTLANPLLDGLTNESLASALTLQPRNRPVPDLRADYTHRGAIESASDVDVFKIRAPLNDGTTLNVLVWGLDADPLNPRIRLFDHLQNPVAFQVLSTDLGVMSVQVDNAVPGSDYYIQILPRTPGTGAYYLAADFNAVELIEFDAMTRDTLSPGETVTDTLQVSIDGVFEIVLAAERLDPMSGGGVTLAVLDENNQVVLQLTADAGQLPTTAVRYLATGTYTLQYTFRPLAGITAGAIQFDLFMLKLNDGVGPYATTTGSDPSAGSGSGGTGDGGGYTYTGSSTTQASSYGYYF